MYVQLWDTVYVWSTARKKGIEQLNILSSKYISKGAIHMVLSTSQSPLVLSISAETFSADMDTNPSNQ